MPALVPPQKNPQKSCLEFLRAYDISLKGSLQLGLYWKLYANLSLKARKYGGNIHGGQSSQMRMKQCHLWIHPWNIENVSNFNSSF